MYVQYVGIIYIRNYVHTDIHLITYKYMYVYNYVCIIKIYISSTYVRISTCTYLTMEI